MFLNRRHHIILSCSLLIGGALCSADAAAQWTDSTWRDMDYIRNSNGWLSSGNVLGLQYLPVNKISDAKIYANKSDGKFVNYYQSDNSYRMGASTESFYRLNATTVFQGKVVYDNFKGKNMGGSAFINPYAAPLDIDEDADTTKGSKKLERYNLFGAVAAKIGRRWTLGGKIDYEAANYTKYKDLRHINKLLNMDVQVGLGYSLNKILEIGVGYDYLRRIESTVFNMYGNTDKQYLSLVNYGSFFGTKELFGSSGVSPGYTLQSNPMVNNTHRISLQAAIHLNPQMEWFNNFSYGMRSGYFGEKESASVVFTEHRSKQYAYNGILSLRRGRSLHKFDIQAGYEKLKNMLNISRPETDQGGTTTYVYYGQNQLLDQKITSAGMGYTAYLGIQNGNPLWTLKAGGNYYRRNQTTTLYPFYRQQLINSYVFSIFGNRNFIQDKDMYSVSLGLAYGSGGGTAKKDGTYITQSSNQTPPATKDNYLYEEYEYFTKPRVRSQLGLKYSRSINPQVTGFAQLGFSYTKASDVTYIGNNFRSLNFTVGCTF
ncbi:MULTISPECIES: DUF6850 family outer membrane beta-barrel protein [Chitinophagaceae]